MKNVGLTIDAIVATPVSSAISSAIDSVEVNLSPDLDVYSVIFLSEERFSIQSNVHSAISSYCKNVLK